MLLGIDYASVDGSHPSSLAAAKAAGLRFAFIRASYNEWTDPTPARDRDHIRASGLIFGAYLFPVTTHEPEPQVEAFIKGAGLIPHKDFAPVLDIEFPGGISKTGKTREELAKWIERCVAELRARFGCNPIIYSSQRVLDGADADSLGGAATHVLEGCPLWLARYPYKTRIPLQDGKHLVAPPVPLAGGDSDGWWFHQWQGDALNFPGFTAAVDADRFNLLTKSSPQGARVRWVQGRIKILGAPLAGPLNVTGRWDADTDHAVRAYQTAHGLVSDGIVGPATFAALSWEP